MHTRLARVHDHSMARGAVPPSHRFWSLFIFAAILSCACASAQSATPVVSSISPSDIAAGPFFITINGTGFATGATVNLNGVASQTSYISSTQLIAEGNASPGPQTLTVDIPGAGASNPVTVTVNASQVSPYAAARFLEQASWGPTPATVAHVQQVGFQQYLREQLAMAPTPIPDAPSATAGLGSVQAGFFYNAMTGQDQLRQRIAFALSEILVVSEQKVALAQAWVPYLRILLADAFGNYSSLLQDISLNPAMGFYLNMLNNDKAHPAVNMASNENYARELMQLFSIGTDMLNPDGTPQLDGNGRAIPAYSQSVVAETARALTGWTYAPLPGQLAQWRAPANYGAPMVAIEANHDTGSKTILNNVVIPAGQSAMQDLQAVLQNVFQHPNVGPFISFRLIQHLVTSNPSPAYVQRVAAVFNDDGTGVRGNMKAVVQSILLDAEARQDDDSATPAAAGGHLAEPVLFITRLLRSLGATVPSNNTLSLAASWMGQPLFNPPNVFSYFSPSYKLPGSQLYAPEFQIHSGTYAMNRVNFVSQLLFGGAAATYGFALDMSSQISLALNPNMLLNSLNVQLMHGQMSSQMRQGILDTMRATSGQKWQAYSALFLTASSSQYQVIH